MVRILSVGSLVVDTTMQSKRFLSLTGFALIGVGLLFTLATPWIFPRILTDPGGGPTLDNLARNIGVFVLAIGVINVVGRDASEPTAVRAILGGSLLSIMLSGALDLHAVLSGLYAPIGWGVIAFKSVVTAGYVYFLLSSQHVARTNGSTGRSG